MPRKCQHSAQMPRVMMNKRCKIRACVGAIEMIILFYAKLTMLLFFVDTDNSEIK